MHSWTGRRACNWTRSASLWGLDSRREHCTTGNWARSLFRRSCHANRQCMRASIGNSLLNDIFAICLFASLRGASCQGHCRLWSIRLFSVLRSCDIRFKWRIGLLWGHSHWLFFQGLYALFLRCFEVSLTHRACLFAIGVIHSVDILSTAWIEVFGRQRVTATFALETPLHSVGCTSSYVFSIVDWANLSTFHIGEGTFVLGARFWTNYIGIVEIPDAADGLLQAYGFVALNRSVLSIELSLEFGFLAKCSDLTLPDRIVGL